MSNQPEDYGYPDRKIMHLSEDLADSDPEQNVKPSFRSLKELIDFVSGRSFSDDTGGGLTFSISRSRRPVRDENGLNSCIDKPGDSRSAFNWSEGNRKNNCCTRPPRPAAARHAKYVFLRLSA